MQTLLLTLQGSKTYSLVAAAILYIIGAKLGLWSIDPEILVLIGAGMAATIRSGIRSEVEHAAIEIADATHPVIIQQKTKGPISPGPLPLLLLLSLLAFTFTACRTADAGHDPVVIRAEQTLTITLDTVDAFLRIEHQHRDTMGTDATLLADELRQHFPTHLNTARLAVQAYKHDRTPDNKATLTRALAAIDVILAHTQAALFNHAALSN